MSQALALAVQTEAEKAIAHQGVFRVVLNGGGTPQRLFEILGELPFRSARFWEDTEIYWGDERCVSPEDEGSNYRQARDAFLGLVSIAAERVHRIRGELGPVGAADDYTARLASLAQDGHRWPDLDLVLLGLGTDGHTASLFPGLEPDRLDVPVIPVRANYAGRPAERVSLAPVVFNSARIIYWMASGAAKAEIVRKVYSVEGDPASVPALQIQPDSGDTVWWLDRAAASGLTQDSQ